MYFFFPCPNKLYYGVGETNSEKMLMEKEKNWVIDYFKALKRSILQPKSNIFAQLRHPVKNIVFWSWLKFDKKHK